MASKKDMRRADLSMCIHNFIHIFDFESMLMFDSSCAIRRTGEQR